MAATLFHAAECQLRHFHEAARLLDSPEPSVGF